MNSAAAIGVNQGMLEGVGSVKMRHRLVDSVVGTYNQIAVKVMIQAAAVNALNGQMQRVKNGCIDYILTLGHSQAKVEGPIFKELKSAGDRVIIGLNVYAGMFRFLNDERI